MTPVICISKHQTGWVVDVHSILQPVKKLNMHALDQVGRSMHYIHNDEGRCSGRYGTCQPRGRLLALASHLVFHIVPPLLHKSPGSFAGSEPPFRLLLFTTESVITFSKLKSHNALRV
jgi:hypothetical protein